MRRISKPSGRMGLMGLSTDATPFHSYLSASPAGTGRHEAAHAPDPPGARAWNQAPAQLAAKKRAKRIQSQT